MNVAVLQTPETGCRMWHLRITGGRHLRLSLTGASFERVRTYEVAVHEEPSSVRVDVHAQVGAAPPAGLETLEGHSRFAEGWLQERLGVRVLVDPGGRRLPVANGDLLLGPPTPWLANAEWYDDSNRSWVTEYRWSRATLLLAQGPPTTAAVDTARPAFPPVQVGRPAVRGVEAQLYTFAAEPDNALLTWVEGDRGVRMEVRGLDHDAAVVLARELTAA